MPQLVEREAPAAAAAMTEPRALGGGMTGSASGSGRSRVARGAAALAGADWAATTRAKAACEALEVGRARGEAGGRRDVDEVVDAAVLLHDVDVVLHRDAVELGAQERVQGLAAVERDGVLRCRSRARSCP